MKVMTTLSIKVSNNFIDDSNMSKFLTNQIYWWSSFSSRRSSLFNKLKLKTKLLNLIFAIKTLPL